MLCGTHCGLSVGNPCSRLVLLMRIGTFGVPNEQSVEIFPTYLTSLFVNFPVFFDISLQSNTIDCYSERPVSHLFNP